MSQSTLDEIQPYRRNFSRQIFEPATVGLTPQQIERIALAFDAAIYHAILERLDGNSSLQGKDRTKFELSYRRKVAELRVMATT